MCQDLANQTMLKMPYVMYPNRLYGKALRQMRSDGFGNFPNPRAEFSQGGCWFCFHVRFYWRDDFHAIALQPQRLPKRINKAFICRTKAANKAFNQSIAMVDIVSAGIEQRKIAVELFAIKSEQDGKTIGLQGEPSLSAIPVLIRTTYHPNWQREDGERCYAATPFYPLTFIRQATQLTSARRWFDLMAAVISAFAVLLFIALLIA